MDTESQTNPGSDNDIQKEFDAIIKPVPINYSSFPNYINSTFGNLGGGLLSLASPAFHPIEAYKFLSPDRNAQGKLTHWGDFEGSLGPAGPFIAHTVGGVKDMLKSIPGEGFGDWIRETGRQCYICSWRLNRSRSCTRSR